MAKYGLRRADSGDDRIDLRGEGAFFRDYGKLECPVDMMERIKADGFLLLPITAEQLVPLRTIPPIHNDPFDRLLVCQSMVEKIPLISYDDKVNAYFAPR